MTIIRVCVLYTYNMIRFRAMATYFLGLPSIRYSRQKQVSNSVKIGRLFHSLKWFETTANYDLMSIICKKGNKLKTKLIFIFDFGITEPTLCLLILYGYPKEINFSLHYDTL